MAALFPDEYMHIGGDENEGKQWDRNTTIQSYMKEKGIKDNHGLQAYFNQRLMKILQKQGKKMIGWDEVLQPTLPKDVVIHSWRGTAALLTQRERDTTAYCQMVTTLI
jgi:hexosaminidase